MEADVRTVQEVTGCSREAAARAVEAAGDGGLELAVELVLSSTGDDDAPQRWEDLDAARQPTKMVCLVRSDLGMGVGKVAAQVSHATLGAYKQTMLRPGGDEMLRSWDADGEPTIVLKVDDQQMLDALLTQAESRGLVTARIADAGRTEVAAGTVTVGAIGPAAAGSIDEVTGRLSLLT